MQIRMLHSAFLLCWSTHSALYNIHSAIYTSTVIFYSNSNEHIREQLGSVSLAYKQEQPRTKHPTFELVNDLL